MLQVSLYRYNPETDEAPYMQDFSVDTGDRDLMVLDVLELIKADLDGSVTYRRQVRSLAIVGVLTVVVMLVIGFYVSENENPIVWSKEVKCSMVDDDEILGHADDQLDYA